MRLFNGEKMEIVLRPHADEVLRMIEIARNLMLDKMDRWILDQLTIEQLENCVNQMQSEIKKRKE